MPAFTLWIFNWHLFTYYAAKINKNTGRTMIIAMRVITGLLLLGCVYILVM